METLTVKHVAYLLTSVARADKDVTIYRAYSGGALYTVARFQSEQAFNAEMARHETLAKAGVCVPKMIVSDRGEKLIIRTMIVGKSALEMLSEGDLSERILGDLFDLYRFARFARLGLDYMPENFIYMNHLLFYIGHDYGPIDLKKNVENYALRYWIYSKEGKEHLRSRGFTIDPARHVLSDAEANKRIVLITIAHW